LHDLGLLFGRRTYEKLAAYSPNASEEEQVIAEPLNTKPKYVASQTLPEPLAWENSKVLTGDVDQAVFALKQEEGRDLHVIGSPDLVDEYRLMIDPLIVGEEKRLFRDGSPPRPLRLVENQVTSTGAILATYATTSP
jgi:dihydrofolate reductase